MTLCMGSVLFYNVFGFDWRSCSFSNEDLLFYAEKIIQDRKKLLKDGVKQDDTQKSQDLLDIVLSAQVNAPRV